MTRSGADPELDDGVVLGLPEAEAIFERMATYPNYALYVAERDGEIVGTFALLIMDNLAHLGAPSGGVEDVVVRASERGRGVGKTMLQHAMAECRPPPMASTSRWVSSAMGLASWCHSRSRRPRIG